MGAGQSLVAIVGPTGSGKTSLAISLAKMFDGEIVCADSRTIYRGMDIGTAKPTAEERAAAPHHCLDLVNPDQRFSAAQFQEVANNAVSDIHSRGKTALVVGGSGLYIDALLYNFSFGVQIDQQIDHLGLPKLQALAAERGLSPSDQTLKNPRHLAGFIKRGGRQGIKSLRTQALILGLDIEKAVLENRIVQRVEKMFDEGVVEETNTLLEKWGQKAPGLQTSGYMPLIDYLKGTIGREEAKLLFIRDHKQLAKRQMTWFKRNKDIHWVASLEEAEQLIKEKIR